MSLPLWSWPSGRRLFRKPISRVRGVLVVVLVLLLVAGGTLVLRLQG